MGDAGSRVRRSVACAPGGFRGRAASRNAPLDVPLVIIAIVFVLNDFKTERGQLFIDVLEHVIRVHLPVN